MIERGGKVRAMHVPSRYGLHASLEPRGARDPGSDVDDLWKIVPAVGLMWCPQESQS
jgi:hypothetical protein